MAAFTTMAIIGSAVVGAAATVQQVGQQKKNSRRTRRRLAEQETKAKEAASLDNTRTDTGAKINLGRGETVTELPTGGAGTGGATDRAGSVGARVGGVMDQTMAGGLKRTGRASKRVGL